MFKKIIILLVALALMASCNQSKNTGHSHDHGGHEHTDGDEHAEENHTISETYWVNNNEVFVEYTHMLLNEVTPFIISITDTKTGKPVIGADVFVAYTMGTKGIKNSAKFDSNNQYVATLKPSQTGQGKLIVSISINGVTNVHSILNVEVFNDVHDIIHDHEAENSQDIKFSKKDSWKIGLLTHQVQKSEFMSVIRTSGEILPGQTSVAQITSNSAGIVNLSSSNVLEGMSVKSGQLLFTVKGKGMGDDNSDVRYQSAKIEYENAKANYIRVSELNKEKIVSDKEFEQVKGDFLKAESKFNTFSQNYSGGNQQLIAKVNGTIKRLLVKDGDYVNAGQVVATVITRGDLLLKAYLPQSEFHHLNEIQDANFRPATCKTIHNILQLNGKIISRGKSVNEGYSIPLYFSFQTDDDHFVANSFAEVYLLTNSGQEVLSVPVESITEEQGFMFVFVQKSGDTYEKREVVIGKNNGKMVEVISGLSAGERVVSTGAYRVRLASKSSAMPAHAHQH